MAQLPAVVRSVLVVVAVLALPAAVQADHHEAGQVEASIREFYGQLAAGEYEAAFSKLMVGASGYLPSGVLKEIPDEETRERVIQMYEEQHEQGARIQRTPQYIKVTVHGDVALVTFLTEGITRGRGDEGAVESVERVSMVWKKQGDAWKIAHFHVSNLESDDD